MRLEKMVLKGVSVFCLLVVTSCSNNTEEPVVDCQLSDLSLSVSSSTNPDCISTGSITLLGEGGTMPYVYSLDGIDFQSNPTFTDLSAGEYNIFVEDNDGCIQSSSYRLLAGPNGVTVNVSTTDSECLQDTGAIEVNAAGGDGNFLYSLDNGPNQSNNSFTNLSSGEYSIKVTDGQGCESIREVRVLANTSLTNQIMPIIANDCAITGCHNGTQSPNLSAPDAVIANAARIRSETQARTMPRNGTLSQNEIDLIACWVDSGALDN